MRTASPPIPEFMWRRRDVRQIEYGRLLRLHNSRFWFSVPAARPHLATAYRIRYSWYEHELKFLAAGEATIVEP